MNTATEPRGWRRWLRNPSIVWPALIIGFVLLTQWTMISELGYRAFGIEPPADKIPWRTDYAAALDEAKQTGKPVLLKFTASWCPPCQAMKRNVWPDADVEKAVTGTYIPVVLDVDEPGSETPARLYEVTTIPRILIVDGNGRVLKDGAYMGRGGMLAFLRPAGERSGT